MTADLVTHLFLLALGLSVLVRLWLNQRQIIAVSAHRERVPEPFAAQISLAAHQKAADYTLAKARLRRWTTLFNAAVLLAWTLGGGLQSAHAWMSGWTSAPIALGVGTVFLVGIVTWSLELPFSLYHTFVIENRFGFNRITGSLFIQDTLKGAVVAAVIGAPLVAAVLWVMLGTGEAWWLYAWALWFGFSLLLSWLFPTVIAPLFNRFSPLQDATLKDAIEALLTRSGFTSKGVYVMDGSRRSSHGNAYFTGLGKHKRIVFFDTLLNSLSQPQILAVLAHELGHFKHRHILKGLTVSAASGLLFFAVLAWLMPQPAFFAGLGVRTPSVDLALLLFVLVAPVFMYFFQPLFARWSRRHEFEADHYAATHSDPRELALALVRLYRDNASTLTPDRLHSAFYDSHPPAIERIRQLGVNVATIPLRSKEL
ncbi:MAG: M48 family metallopeptidase [Thiotrichales bacterium]